MPDIITIVSSRNSLAVSFADELEAEFAERLRNDGILLKRGTLEIASEGSVPPYLAMTFACTVIGGLTVVYTTRLIDFVVEKCKKTKSTEVDKLSIKVIYDANRKGKGNRSFSIPSQASEAKEFFRQAGDNR